jgi:hypothetical protein
MPSGLPSDRDLLAGSYRILEKIDGSGRLFKASDIRQRRIVALKVLPPSFARDPAERRAFAREIDAALRLKHPNIGAALAAFEDRGVPFVVTEYVEGSDLDRVVRHRGPLPLGQAIDILIQAARGLEAAHAQGIVHRDLKPSKLMLDTDGTVRVLGLGLARLVAAANPWDQEASPRRSDGGMDIAVVDYMAPERAEDSRRADVRADIYSLGCILYFLLTGREPFVGDTILERLTAHRDRPAPILRVLRPDAPTALEETYQKMLAKRPTGRPASMTEVISLLESSRAAVAAGPPSKRAVPQDPPERTASGDGRRKGRSSAQIAGRDAPVFAQGDEADGLPIGPEFSLEGLGIDVHSQDAPVAAPGPPIKRAIELRSAESARPAPAHSSTPRWAGRPAILLGLAAIAALVATVVRFAFHSGERESASPAPPQSTGVAGAPASGRDVDRETKSNPEVLPPPEWTSRTIFDGKTPRGWMLTNKTPLPRKHVQPDGLNPRGTGSYLVVYEQKLGDFILEFDYKFTRGCNSGVFLRVGDLDNPVNTGIEVSLQDTAGTDFDDPGAIFGVVAPSVNAQKPAGEWNHATITAKGPVIAVSLNGADVARINLDEWTVPGKRPDGTDHTFKGLAIASLPRTGYLGFQDLVGDCWFKNIKLKTRPSPADRSDGGHDR